jgi:hypothetical protein
MKNPFFAIAGLIVAGAVAVCGVVYAIASSIVDKDS